MGPTILLDKSALFSLSQDELQVLRRYYYVVIPPITMTEILGETSKLQENPFWGLIRLAQKLPFEYIDSVEHTRLCMHSLLGEPVCMDGRPAKPGGQDVYGLDGRHGVVWDVSDTNKRLLRWSRGEVTQEEMRQAQLWRELKSGPYLEQFKQHMERLPNQPALRDAREAVDYAKFCGLSNEPSIKHGSLSIAIGIAGVNDAGATEAYNVWLKAGMPRLIDYAPYAHYCFVVFTSFYFGLMSGLVKTSHKASSGIDLLYLYYLPFCKAFCSDDTFHTTWAPLLIDQRQCQFMERDQLKTDLRKIAGILKDRPLAQHVTGIDSPPQYPGSITNDVWDRCCRR